MNWLIQGNSAHLPLRDQSVHCVVTSPPYWGLRDYGLAPVVWGGTSCIHRWKEVGVRKSSGGLNGTIGSGQGQATNAGSLFTASQGSFCLCCSAWLGTLGLEPTPDIFITHLVHVFKEIWRVLRDDGVAWLNLGDSFASEDMGFIKRKDLVGVPWMTALALRDAGWYLRSDIIWNKPNPMPESVTDRPSKSHEYVFMLTKSTQYYYDADAVKEDAKDWSIGGPGVGIKTTERYHPDNGGNAGLSMLAMKYKDGNQPQYRNRRSVWSVPTIPYGGFGDVQHFATFPPDLVKPMILAGCPEGGIVMDPFSGSGTVGEVCSKLGRKSVMIEMNWDYISLARRRTAQMGLL